MPSLRLAKIAGFTILVLLVLSNLVLPAGAHITKRLPHLQKHLDSRYVNLNEKAADANLLDGQDSTAFLGANAKAADADLLDGQNSTAFLGANAKAADADLLDGQNSTAFMAGPGKAVKGAVAILPGGQQTILFEEGFEVHYACPLTLTNLGAFQFVNHAGTVNLFIDNGSTNPTYQQVADETAVLVDAAANGEFITFQVHSATHGITTIHAMSVHRPSDCHAQAQAVISS
jgi:hypothetical protein